MPFDNNLLMKSESPLVMAVHIKLPALSISKEAPSLISKEETRSLPFFMASSKGVFPKVSRKNKQLIIVWYYDWGNR